MAVVGFWPTPVDKPIRGTFTRLLDKLHGVGVPLWVDYSFVEASANVALFIPFGILTAVVLPDTSRWRLIALGLLTSMSVEVGQMLFFANRYSTFMDVVTNSLGTVIGVTTARWACSKRAPSTNMKGWEDWLRIRRSSR
ncbi:VanZ family protein [Paenarthrobacter nicotinovorans]|uniref:VanZ family protein n=1 Tax=Paenarthrobacter nicotinovorans TaxID=29320 RepID=UPI003D677A8E